MKVILREDVPEIGQAGQTIDVKDGYGRNFLLPRNLAIEASKANLQAIDIVTKQKEHRDRKLRREAEVVRDKIEKLELQTEVLVGEEDKVFGSVTVHNIMEMLAEKGITVTKNMISLDSPIKALGVYTVPVHVDKSVQANLKLWVVKKS
ncbi:MAG: 50S ribosomal protein L9 [bacterium]